MQNSTTVLSATMSDSTIPQSKSAPECDPQVLYSEDHTEHGCDEIAFCNEFFCRYQNFLEQHPAPDPQVEHGRMKDHCEEVLGHHGGILSDHCVQTKDLGCGVVEVKVEYYMGDDLTKKLSITHIGPSIFQACTNAMELLVAAAEI